MLGVDWHAQVETKDHQHCCFVPASLQRRNLSHADQSLLQTKVGSVRRQLAHRISTDTWLQSHLRLGVDQPIVLPSMAACIAAKISDGLVQCSLHVATAAAGAEAAGATMACVDGAHAQSKIVLSSSHRLLSSTVMTSFRINCTGWHATSPHCEKVFDVNRLVSMSKPGQQMNSGQPFASGMPLECRHCAYGTRITNAHQVRAAGVKKHCRGDV